MPGKKRLRLSSSRDIRQSLNRIANMLLNGELDPKTANAIMYACSISLNANITGNSFTVTFAALTGLVVTGVWNETYQRVEF